MQHILGTDCAIQGCTGQAASSGKEYTVITCLVDGCGHQMRVGAACSKHAVVGVSPVYIETHTISCTVCNKTGKAPKTCTNCDTSFQETYNKGCSHSQFGEHYVNS